MFIIYPNNPGHWGDALFILSYYHVSARFYSDGENVNSTYAVVEPTSNNESLAETAFQMEWLQAGKPVCDHCKHSEEFCGHLVFVKPINTDHVFTEPADAGHPQENLLREALKWWEEDAQYLTTGDYGEYNVFDDDPDWVKTARDLLD